MIHCINTRKAKEEASRVTEVAGVWVPAPQWMVMHAIEVGGLGERTGCFSHFKFGLAVHIQDMNSSSWKQMDFIRISSKLIINIEDVLSLVQS